VLLALNSKMKASSNISVAKLISCMGNCRNSEQMVFTFVYVCFFSMKMLTKLQNL